MHEMEIAPRQKPSLLVAGALSVLLVIAMVFLRVAVYPHRIVPLTYALALLIALWHGDRRLLWGMAGCFVLVSAIKVGWLVPGRFFDEYPEEFVFVGMQWVNILVPAAVIQIVLNHREQLQRANGNLATANAELEASNQELAAREEEISQQNQELQAQTEELAQQGEELRRQTEELQSLAHELAGPQATLEMLLQLSSGTASEAQLLAQVCSAAPKLLGEDVSAIAVLERCNGHLAVRAHSAYGCKPPFEALPGEATLAALAMERGEVAQLEDTRLRPDLRFTRSPSGSLPRSVLCAPVLLQGEAVGAIEAYAAEPRPWTSQQTRFLQWLSRQCAQVWEAIRLRDERQRAEEDLKKLNQTLEQQVAERTKAMQMLRDIAAMANQAQSTEEAIECCLERVAMYNGWCFGHALVPAADDPDELVPAYAHYAEDSERFRRFREVTFGLRLHRGQGLPGRMLASGKPQWTADLHHDLVERRAVVAEELGIGAAIAFPVVLGDRVAAVLEFFSDRVIRPNGKIADAMVGVGLQLGRVIERAGFEEHLLSIAEDIQRGIAQDLHDDVGQELTGLGLKAATLAEMLAPATTRAGKLAVDIAVALERTHDKIRWLCRGILPIELEEGLLAEALGQLTAATSESSRIRCEFACRHPDPVFDSRVSMHLYRIAQEAVSNAVRHSGAENIRIALRRKTRRTYS